MITRRSSLATAVAVVGLTVLAVAGASASSIMTWWHNLSQTSRNNHIVNVADDDVGDYVGLSCKEWVRAVVEDASNGEVTIPPNTSSNTRWQSHPDCHRYAPPFPDSAYRAGYIIQMKWRNANGSVTPHTAIVYSRNSNGMVWAHSNWHGDQRVTTEFIPYTLFHQRVGSNYSVYKIE